MCFVYLAFDVALKEIVWYCKIRRVGGPADVPEMRMGLPGNIVLRTVKEVRAV
jgi:hypothetical protein